MPSGCSSTSLFVYSPSRVHSPRVQDNDGGRTMTLYFENPDQLEEINSYIDQLRARDDRSCVIMIAARIESLLQSAMDRQLIDLQSTRRKGVMGNLPNMIDFSHRLGILHSTHAEALHALRRIRNSRNSAAHFDKPMSLDDHLRDVEDFFRLWMEGRASAQFRSLVKREQTAGTGDGRARFLVATSTFFVFLKPLATGVPKLDPLPWLRQIDGA